MVGVVETHGRAETEALLAACESCRARAVDHRGVELEEFDLDAALARKPELILVDELAHTNAPGSRHAKRWQDVLELLDAGIDVYTTLNVQHVESLNDVVAQITGVQVRETVPDCVLERADEIELVDLPPGGAARAPARGQGLPPRAGGAGDRALLPARQPARAARARAAAHGRAGRRRRPGLPPRARHRRDLADRASGSWSASAPSPSLRAADPRRPRMAARPARAVDRGVRRDARTHRR